MATPKLAALMAATAALASASGTEFPQIKLGFKPKADPLPEPDPPPTYVQLGPRRECVRAWARANGYTLAQVLRDEALYDRASFEIRTGP